ncbi:MAG: alpha/beta hydrolase family protein [Armatimonadota bacterium]
MGGSRDGYEYLGRHWAGYGYVSVHLTHKGSDTAVWQGKADPMAAMRQAAADPRNALNRPRDVSFAIDQLEKMNREDTPLKGRLDLAKIAVAGHSFGAYTALATAGMSFTIAGKTYTLADPRVKAAIPMSAPVNNRKETYKTAYGSIRIPCLHMTGTKDVSSISDTTAEQRRIPYDHIRLADQYLLTFTNGDHLIFSGRPRPTPGDQTDALFQKYILISSTAFLDAYLRNETAAKTWLSDGSFAKALGIFGVWEQRLVK